MCMRMYVCIMQIVRTGNCQCGVTCQFEHREGHRYQVVLFRKGVGVPAVTNGNPCPHNRPLSSLQLPLVLPALLPPTPWTLLALLPCLPLTAPTLLPLTSWTLLPLPPLVLLVLLALLPCLPLTAPTLLPLTFWTLLPLVLLVLLALLPLP
jgi:hypothetical protein